MIAIQANGSVACGTTTNGASHKVAGRVGDSPIVGSGAYCESAVGGAAGQPAPNAVAGSLDCCDALQPLVMETS